MIEAVEAYPGELAELRRFKAGADALVEKWRIAASFYANTQVILAYVSCAEELAALSKEVGG